MKVFAATLGTETNTFASLPTGMESFRETCLFHGDATQHPKNLYASPMFVWREMCEENDIEFIEGLSAFATPGGLTVKTVYEELRDEILDNLEAALPLEGVLIFVHGCMVAQGYDDCEGDLLARVRDLVGEECTIGVEFDLHAILTPQMIANSDILIAFKEYPHVDVEDRAREVANLTFRTMKGEIKPLIKVFDTHMVNLLRTTLEPMTGFVAQMTACEVNGEALSVSYVHAFPWADAPYSYSKFLAITDNDPVQAENIARRFGEKIISLREQTKYVTTDMNAAIDNALAGGSFPVVLVDTADNAGAGAPSDSTFLLRALLDKGVQNFAAGLYWDVMSVRLCMEAGEGANLRLRIGGKIGAESGDPFDLEVQVMKIIPNARQPFGESEVNLGDSVWIRTKEDIDLVLTSHREQTLHPDAFSQFGITLEDKTFVCVKSLQHFHAGFSELTDNIVYLAVPGALDMDFANINYQKMTEPYWPRVVNL